MFRGGRGGRLGGAELVEGGGELAKDWLGLGALALRAG